jgi:hypothetical protein
MPQNMFQNMQFGTTKIRSHTLPTFSRNRKNCVKNTLYLVRMRIDFWLMCA